MNKTEEQEYFNSIVGLIKEECQKQDLTVSIPGMADNEILISNIHETSLLPVYIISPFQYFPEKRLTPYHIETACLFHIRAIEFQTKPLLIFNFQNETSGKTEFIIVETTDLIKKFAEMSKLPNSDGNYKMIIYAVSDNLILDATEISAEGEWYFVGGRMGENTKWDFSQYLNRWDEIFNHFNHESTN